jgi:L-amino acid N-acyltransferase YncA
MNNNHIEVRFRSLRKKDWDSVAEIYKQGIESGNATFETEIPSWDKWDSKHLKTCRIATEYEKKVIAWAALVPVSDRKVYSGVAEITIYVSNKYQGLKIGTKLLEKMILESEKAGIWTLQAVIFPGNTASLKIHQKHGFREVGYREKIGKMNGNWRDTILLERRSKVVGTNSNIKNIKNAL